MKTDPITLELFKNALFSIADEMAVTVCRTTYSGVLRDNMDFSTAFTDGQGRLVAQGLTIPLHLGSIPTALEAVLARFHDDCHPGDVFIVNDPYAGGMHLPDIFVFKPIFVEGERVAFAATICHHADVGGRVPGSNASDSTEIFQEGVRIPPMKLYDRGAANETLWTLLEANVRIPVPVFGDLRAQLAACTIAESQFMELVDRYGIAATTHYMGEVLELGVPDDDPAVLVVVDLARHGGARLARHRVQQLVEVALGRLELRRRERPVDDRGRAGANEAELRVHRHAGGRDSEETVDVRLGQALAPEQDVAESHRARA